MLHGKRVRSWVSPPYAQVAGSASSATILFNPGGFGYEFIQIRNTSNAVNAYICPGNNPPCNNTNGFPLNNNTLNAQDFLDDRTSNLTWYFYGAANLAYIVRE
jgi:hypothetical protein